MPIRFPTLDVTYLRDLPGFSIPSAPEAAPHPKLLFWNEGLARDLGIDPSSASADEIAEVFSGQNLPEGAAPTAQAYAGHQFGHFVPQLGDGRALLWGEIVDQRGQRRDLAFKGSGRTAFSRRGDGKAAVGPMLREVLIGEGMHALGIPTSRALAVVATGETIRRERRLPGAILTRVAASHIRVGTFEYFAARDEKDKVAELAEYAIARHEPQFLGDPDRFLKFFQAVADKQAALIARWMDVGFLHGVMNTDNMAISGETIDYGPCAFLESYHPATVFSSIDHQGRYSYQNQPSIARWNLARLGETLLPLLAPKTEDAIALVVGVIQSFPLTYQRFRLQGLRAKLGLARAASDLDASDLDLAETWLSLLQTHKADFTLAWRFLSKAAEGHEEPLRSLLPARDLDPWLQRWRSRCRDEDQDSPSPQDSQDRRAHAMKRINPWLIPRNHRVEEALEAASSSGDLAPFLTLLSALQDPFQESPAFASYAEPAPPSFAEHYQTFCGT